MKGSSTLKKVVISSTFATGLFLATQYDTADAALGDQTLRKGQSHPDVKELQEALKKKGFFNYHTSTGYFGSITEDAVREFQMKHGLQVDGIAGPQTLNALLSQMNGNNGGQQTSSSTPSSTSNSTILRFGSSGQAVRDLQEKLKAKGFYNHSITGQYGRITTEAVREFQRANRLSVDGIAGPQTLAALTNQAPAASAPQYNAPVQQTTVLRQGSRGDAVRDLQRSLKDLGYYKSSIDGIFGAGTTTAVREFQRKMGLTVDGVAGPQTLSALNVNPRPNTSNGQSSSSGGHTAPSGNRGATITNIVANASELIGTPYVWGGTTPRGFDCSGFVQYVFAQQGVSIPRTVAQMWNAGTSVSQPSVGDIVFFDTTGGPSHNGIYIGNNQFIHSGSSTGVTIASMNNSYWASRYLGAKRLY
ncbi:peptidoglycan-binding protein [Halalkalibacterium halodurans]|uniref:C40 family peptidase n=2 Tax=Halalkalibacterium halodurans TaxID=86665 RepID=UPI002E248DD4|nr:peptidoglycan-binding protein [Halalkalibacterium halodurans]MED4083635.1 peptidoglycan-binding protein [Halalkalibacterium halodurans]MED4106611.1 peptidoglycan-binding protein [Halalkalibacterium halodurans]MED4107873.1 peptidoglycan-binding protein [Halalkalibacterium halodurans]MED4123011.1 peptidoglycan-binding protein [Halalkalibacterium halodurans]